MSVIESDLFSCCFITVLCVFYVQYTYIFSNCGYEWMHSTWHYLVLNIRTFYVQLTKSSAPGLIYCIQELITWQVKWFCSLASPWLMMCLPYFLVVPNKVYTWNVQRFNENSQCNEAAWNQSCQLYGGMMHSRSHGDWSFDLTDQLSHSIPLSVDDKQP